MKKSKSTAFAALLLAVMLFMGTSAEAKKVQLPKVYMFGFAASFNDTIVHFTEVQEVNDAWMEKKRNFLIGRELYSLQLREFLRDERKMGNRTCIVVCEKKKKKAEKKYLKFKKLYGKDKEGNERYDVRFLNSTDFHFKPVDVRDELYDEEGNLIQEQPKADKKKKKKDKK